MPLIVISGFPSSGKSRTADELKNYFEARQKGVFIISENNCYENANVTYNDSKLEKVVRGKLKAAATQRINNDDVVILDGLNYIKGFRYELFCISKQHKSNYCVVQCVPPIDTAWEWNLKKQEEHQYSRTTFDALIQRYESPDSRNRWDSPLFTVMLDAEIAFNAIYSHLFERSAPTPNQSTQLQPLSDNNFLFVLDKCTQDVIMALMNAQKMQFEGRIHVEGAAETIKLDRKVSLREVTQMRRQFINFAKSQPSDDTRKLKDMFIQYLNKTLDL